ncbi:hypothetical protein PFISCL1PPCAC_517, partial [Pristionchus fissidentatus]
DLPLEMLDGIVSYTDIKSKLALRRVCYTTKSVVDAAARHPTKKVHVDIHICGALSSDCEIYALRLSIETPILLLPLMSFFRSWKDD